MTAVTKSNNYGLRDFTILESKTWTIPQFRFAVYSFCLQIVTGFFVIPKCFLDSSAGVLQFLDGPGWPRYPSRFAACPEAFSWQFCVNCLVGHWRPGCFNGADGGGILAKRSDNVQDAAAGTAQCMS